ncbi:MAG: hypothetical protein WC867_03160 [Candidatus Pacearchaeota archaeon]|jgi:hypothetical protein
MKLFKQKCQYCSNKIERGKEIIELVKVPEFTGLREKPFCSKEHAHLYKDYVIGTPRTSYCPSCGV